MGVIRATWLSRGIALPRRGSPRDLVLRELMLREYTAKAAETGLFARILGISAGVPADNISAALELFFNEITHARYGPEGHALNEKILQRVQKQSESPDELKERLMKVASLNSPR